MRTFSKLILLSMTCGAMLSSCDSADHSDFSSNTAVAGRAATVTICHLNNEGEYVPLTINQHAVNGHLRHGDYLLDIDGDGYTEVGACTGSADDCDDNDTNVNPEADEACDDGIDNDCDGQTDEGCADCCWSESNPDIFNISDPRYWNHNAGSPCGGRGKTLDIFICFDPGCGHNFIWIEGDPGAYFCWVRGVGDFETQGVLISDAEALACSQAIQDLAADLGLANCNGSGLVADREAEAYRNCPLGQSVITE